MSKIDFTPLIDSYLDGSINKADRSQLFEAMEKDPALKSEFQLQSNIVESLKTYRKVELKARLASIEVGSGATGFIGLKIASVAVISALMFTGAYYFYDAQNPKLDIGQIEIEKQNIENDPLPLMPPASGLQDRVVYTQEAIKPVAKSVEKAQPIVQSTKPVVIEPNLMANLEDKEPSISNEQPSFEDNTLAKTSEKAKPSIEVFNESSKNFEYKFFNNKLYLFGDFGKIPYEILELNSSEGKRLYLFYLNEYYSLKMNQIDRVPLEKVLDVRLIKELEIIKNNK